MKLSTSTNIIHMRPDGGMWPLPKTLEVASRAGWKRFDLNFYDWSLPNTPFLTEDWQAWIEQVAETKDRLNLEFGQCHAYFYNFLDKNLSEEEHQHQQMLVERSLKCCKILGSNLCVTHPETDFFTDKMVQESKKQNIEYFKRLIDYCSKLDMALALENMCDYSISPRRKYGVTTEELVDLIDSFADHSLGICWDFEHAHIMQQDQRKSLLALGHRLKATHVSDTHSTTDPDLMHVMPCFGKINWQEIMDTLREINYQGDFSFEAHNYANTLPDCLLPTAMKLSYEIGEYLINL